MVSLATARRRRKPYQVRPTFAGIPSCMWGMKNPCVAYAVIRMFPFLDPKRVMSEFRRLDGERSGLDFEEMAAFFGSLGVMRYLKTHGWEPGERPSLKEMSLMRMRSMAIVKIPKQGFHINFIRRDGLILDTEPTPVRLKAWFVFTVRKDKEEAVRRRIDKWKKSHAAKIDRSRKYWQDKLEKGKAALDKANKRATAIRSDLRDYEECLETIEEEAQLLEGN